jgi:DNA-binding LacI/PurR family transcriptional regulator
MQPRRPTISDVARVAGVSRAAASRVINDTPGVAVDVRQRVRQVINDLGYQPNPAARALASGRADVVELVILDCASSTFGVNPYYGRVVAGMLSALDPTAARMRLHLAAAEDITEVMAEISRSAAGALLVNVPAALVVGAGDRVVSMHASAPGVPFVDTHNEAGAGAAVRHLIENGRRRVVGLHGPVAHPCAVERHDGYLDAIRAAGLTPISGGGEFKRDVGYGETARLLAEHPDIDALFAACDLMAVGAMQALSDAGRRVPDDVAVVGFDDSLIAVCANPPMTSVRQPVEEMAAAATRALLERRLRPGWQQMFPAELVVRASSGGAG